jgi:eukaryotic-like serine/threonine-protein kinase
MAAPAAERSTCATCGAALQETSAGELGCLPCLLRAGLTNADEIGQDRHRTDRFGAYVIERREDGSLFELGRGANGVTYRAIDTALQRKVALKIIVSESATQSAGERERFTRGARAAASLRHEHVATIYHFGIQEESGEYFYAMELVEGETLEERVRRTGPLDARSTIALAQQVVSALSAAEKCGVIHRDLKPGNIMLAQADESLQVKVIDFGLAKVVGEVADPMTLTHGGFVGTPAFASPEQFAHKPLDVRSDVYSLGGTLWFALTGRTPFAGADVEAIRAAQISGALPMEKLKAARVPQWLMSILQSMLALEPAARPSVGQLREELQRGEARTKILGRRTAVSLFVMLIISAFVFFFSRSRNPATPSTPEHFTKSLAVLPFTNVSRDPDGGYFAYGIRAGITSRLSQISDLKLVAVASPRNTDGSAEPVKQLAAALDVTTLLQGTLQKEGDKFHITVHLKDANNDVDLWSQSYDRTFSGVAEIEKEVAEKVAGALGLEVDQPEKRALAHAPPSDPRAYEAYLKGRYVWLQRTSDSYMQAKEYFERAIAIDPHYAAAHAGLADAYQFLGAFDFNIEHRGEFYAKAKQACQRALELDPQLAEAHASRGLIAMNYDWEWAVAEAEFKRAIELDPNNGLIRDWYAEFARTVGRAEESLHQMTVARQLDPFSTLINSDLGKILYFARRYDQATAQLKETVRMDPAFDQPHLWLGYTYVATGKYSEAIEEFQRLWEKGRSSWQAGLMAYAYGVAGRKTEAEPAVAFIRRDFASGVKADKLPLLLACIGSGDKDCAFHCLEEDYRTHSTTISGLKSAPYFDSLRSDPRFDDLMRRVHLAP